MSGEDNRLRELGALIRQARKKRNLTVTELGKLVYGDSGKSNVSRVERGEIGVAPDTALRYLEHLGLDDVHRRRFLELTGLTALAMALQRQGVLLVACDEELTQSDNVDRPTESELDDYCPSPYSLARPQILWIAASKLDQEGHWEQAQNCYRVIAETVPVGSEQVRARIAHAHEFINLGDLHAAERELQHILGEYGATVDALTLAQGQFRLGWIHHMAGRYRQAEQYFLHALHAARQFADIVFEAEVLNFLGRNLYETARKLGNAELMEAALQCFDKATEVTPPGHPLHSFHLRWAARACEYLKRYREMHDCRDEALWMWKADKAPYRAAYVYVDNARSDLQTGRRQQAMEELYEAAELFADARCADNLAECLVALAETYFEHGRLASVHHITDLCISAVCLYPYPESPSIETALRILHVLHDADPETITKRLMQMRFEPVFSARTARDLVPESLESRADLQAGYRILMSALKKR